MSTGYESSSMGKPPSAAADDHRDSTREWGSGSQASRAMAPTPAADVSPSQGIISPPFSPQDRSCVYLVASGIDASVWYYI